MTERTYSLVDGVVATDDGRTSIPLDPANADYRAYLATAGKTHGQVVAETKAAADTKTAGEATRRTAQAKAARSGRAKLLALGLTRAEFRALFTDPDPED